MFDPSRAEARRFFFDVWAKHRDGRPLSPLEDIALSLLLAHSEYHGILDAPDRHLDRDYLPEFGETNPFLHLSLHLAVEEQENVEARMSPDEAHYAALRRFGNVDVGARED